MRLFEWDSDYNNFLDNPCFSDPQRLNSSLIFAHLPREPVLHAFRYRPSGADAAPVEDARLKQPGIYFINRKGDVTLGYCESLQDMVSSFASQPDLDRFTELYGLAIPEDRAHEDGINWLCNVFQATLKRTSSKDNPSSFHFCSRVFRKGAKLFALTDSEHFAMDEVFVRGRNLLFMLSSTLFNLCDTGFPVSKAFVEEEEDDDDDKGWDWDEEDDDDEYYDEDYESESEDRSQDSYDTDYYDYVDGTDFCHCPAERAKEGPDSPYLCHRPLKLEPNRILFRRKVGGHEIIAGGSELHEHNCTHVTVTRGSYVCREKNELKGRLARLNSRLINSHALKEHDSGSSIFILQEDVIFENHADAATFITGIKSSGDGGWSKPVGIRTLTLIHGARQARVEVALHRTEQSHTLEVLPGSQILGPEFVIHSPEMARLRDLLIKNKYIGMTDHWTGKLKFSIFFTSPSDATVFLCCKREAAHKMLEGFEKYPYYEDVIFIEYLRDLAEI